MKIPKDKISIAVAMVCGMFWILESYITNDESSERDHLLAASSLGSVVKSEPASNSNKISKAKSRFFFVFFLFLFFMGAALFSIPAPFFPNHAIQKGMSQTVAGLVLGSMQLVQFVTGICFAFTMFHFGVKFLLCYGIFWASSCALLFGIIDLGPDDISYTILCFAIRLIQGIGVSAYFISSMTITGVVFSENYGFVTGIMQTGFSLGTLVGPSIGGALYSVGGYFCPFAVMGGLLMVFAPIAAVTIPSDICSSDAKSHETPAKVFRQMLSPSLLALFYTMLVATMTSVVTDTTMGVRLAQFGITNPLVVGAVYLSSSAAFGITAPIAGRLADKFDAGWIVMFGGTILAIIGYLIVGPTPLFGALIKPGLVQLIIGVFIAHCGVSSCILPMTRELQRLASTNGLDKHHPSTLSFVSAFFECSWGLGGFLGAFLGGALMENVGFPLTTTIQAAVMLPSILLQLFLMYKFGHCAFCSAKRKGYGHV